MAMISSLFLINPQKDVKNSKDLTHVVGGANS